MKKWLILNIYFYCFWETDKDGSVSDLCEIFSALIKITPSLKEFKQTLKHD